MPVPQSTPPTTARQPKISFQGAQKLYAGKGVSTLALDSFSLDIMPTEVISIVGCLAVVGCVDCGGTGMAAPDIAACRGSIAILAIDVSGGPDRPPA